MSHPATHGSVPTASTSTVTPTLLDGAPPGSLKSDVCRAALCLLRGLVRGDHLTWGSAVTGTFAGAERLTDGAYAWAVDLLERTGAVAVGDPPLPRIALPRGHSRIPGLIYHLPGPVPVIPGVIVAGPTGQRLRLDLGRMPEDLKSKVRDLPASELHVIEVVNPSADLLAQLREYIMPASQDDEAPPSWDCEFALVVRGVRYHIPARLKNLRKVLDLFAEADPPWPRSVAFADRHAYKHASRAGQQLRKRGCPLSFHIDDRGRDIRWEIATQATQPGVPASDDFEVKPTKTADKKMSRRRKPPVGKSPPKPKPKRPH